jgi:rubredoxin-NAD+ reductase
MYGIDRHLPEHPGHPGKRRWICRICGFIYDEAVGDVHHGFAPGTPWEDIPSDWLCPVCRVTKSDFDPLLD